MDAFDIRVGFYMTQFLFPQAPVKLDPRLPSAADLDAVAAEEQVKLQTGANPAAPEEQQGGVE